MKRGDIWIGVIVLAVIVWFAIPLFQGGEEAGYASIMVDGNLFKTVALTQEEQIIEIRTERGYNKLRVVDGGIEMVEADCPDQLCLGFGHIHRTNESIVCLPHRVVVEVTHHAGGGDEIDAIVK